MIHVDALIGFTYPERRKSFSQLVYCGKNKYSHLILLNIQNNSENFLVTF